MRKIYLILIPLFSACTAGLPIMHPALYAERERLLDSLKSLPGVRLDSCITFSPFAIEHEIKCWLSDVQLASVRGSLKLLFDDEEGLLTMEFAAVGTQDQLDEIRDGFFARYGEIEDSGFEDTQIYHWRDTLSTSRGRGGGVSSDRTGFRVIDLRYNISRGLIVVKWGRRSYS